MCEIISATGSFSLDLNQWRRKPWVESCPVCCDIFYILANDIGYWLSWSMKNVCKEWESNRWETRNAMDGQTAERQRKFLSRTRTKHWMVVKCSMDTSKVTIFRVKKYSAEHWTEIFDSFFHCKPFLRKMKSSEFRSEHFRRRELCNFVPNHSPEDNNARHSFLNHFAEEKTLGISFRTIKRKKTPLEIHSKPIKDKE
jgi:hypothetical protein